MLGGRTLKLSALSAGPAFERKSCFFVSNPGHGIETAATAAQRCLPEHGRSPVAVCIATLGFIGSLAALTAEAAPADNAGVGAARQIELVTLVRQDCGSCHGLTLHGGLGPALLPETLEGKPPDHLKFVILQGRPGTAMPPWRRFLSDSDADWIVLKLRKGFPR